MSRASTAENIIAIWKLSPFFEFLISKIKYNSVLFLIYRFAILQAKALPSPSISLLSSEIQSTLTKILLPML